MFFPCTLCLQTFCLRTFVLFGHLVKIVSKPRSVAYLDPLGSAFNMPPGFRPAYECGSGSSYLNIGAKSRYLLRLAKEVASFWSLYVCKNTQMVKVKTSKYSPGAKGIPLCWRIKIWKVTLYWHVVRCCWPSSWTQIRVEIFFWIWIRNKWMRIRNTAPKTGTYRFVFGVLRCWMSLLELPDYTTSRLSLAFHLIIGLIASFVPLHDLL